MTMQNDIFVSQPPILSEHCFSEEIISSDLCSNPSCVLMEIGNPHVF